MVEQTFKSFPPDSENGISTPSEDGISDTRNKELPSLPPTLHANPSELEMDIEDAIESIEFQSVAPSEALCKPDDELEDLKKERDRLRRFYERSKQKNENLSRENASLKKALRQKDVEIGALAQSADDMKLELAELNKVVNKQNRDVTGLMEDIERQRVYILELKNKVAVQQRNITELTEVISRSAHSINTVTRDDAYFDGEFASLAGSIRQWAFRHFRDGPKINHRNLSQRLKDTLGATTLHYSATLDRTFASKDIEAAATEMIVNWAFRSSLVFRIVGEGYPLVLEVLGGTDRERRELQSQMVTLLMINSDFNINLRNKVHHRTERVFRFFRGLVKAGGEEKCERALFSIIEKAAQLGFEIDQQVSEFETPRIEPGSVYEGWKMEDASDTVDEDEESEGPNTRFIVQSVLFPPVLRWDLDETGMFREKPVTVRRATVTVKDREIN